MDSTADILRLMHMGMSYQEASARLRGVTPDQDFDDSDEDNLEACDENIPETD